MISNKRCYLSSLMIFLVYLTVLQLPTDSIYAADKGHYSEDTVISLDFKDEPLNQVLKEISWLTGYSFVINKEYADLKITGSLKDVPLHQGLKKILDKHSHTITYEPNKTVTLAIYKSSPRAPVIFDPNDSFSPFNYMISPENMGELNAGFGAYGMERNVLNQEQFALQQLNQEKWDQDQWDQDQWDQDQWDQDEEDSFLEDDGSYEAMEDMEYEEDIDSDTNLISKKRSAPIGSKQISPEIIFGLESDDDLQEYEEPNEYQDYDETLPMEDDQYNRNILPE